MTCIVGIACFHTTESQHWVYWEYYLYELWVLFVWAGSIICMGKTDVLRCQVVTDSESLGGRRAEKSKADSTFEIYLSKYIYLYELKDLFV